MRETLNIASGISIPVALYFGYPFAALPGLLYYAATLVGYLFFARKVRALGGDR